MIYLLLGEDNLLKDQKIAEIKKQYLASQDSIEFDYEILDAGKLDPDSLRKACLSLPAVSPKRVILIRNAHQLNSRNQNFILDFILIKQTKVILILDSNELNIKDSFVDQLRPLAKISYFPTGVQENVFDVTTAMSQHNLTEALRILSGLTAQGIYPLQIMGALMWFWEKSRNRLRADRFRMGLRFFQEADLNIKRSRLRPEMALEVLVVKLTNIF